MLEIFVSTAVFTRNNQFLLASPPKITPKIGPLHRTPGRTRSASPAGRSGRPGPRVRRGHLPGGG